MSDLHTMQEFQRQVRNALEYDGAMTFLQQVGSKRAPGRIRGYVDFRANVAAWEFQDSEPRADRRQPILWSIVDGVLRMGHGDGSEAARDASVQYDSPVAALWWLLAASECTRTDSGWRVLVEASDPRVAATLLPEIAQELRGREASVGLDVDFSSTGVISRMAVNWVLEEVGQSVLETRLAPCTRVPMDKFVDTGSLGEVRDLWDKC